MKRYNPKDIEPRWQKTWADSKIYQASEDPAKPKRYVLEFFPYPSGAAMHVGHVRNYAIGDVIARHARMTGHNVLHPMGWDAFGLPAENFAIKNNVSPHVAVAANTKKFKQQLVQMGFSYDWSREINSTDPHYYKWTQWFFTYLFNRGLAYRKESLVNWDPVDKTVLANEQVIDGYADRSGAKVEKIPLAQWFFKITDYADRLVEDLEDLNWSESIKSMQRNWIGRSSGAEITFKVKDSSETVSIFTTRHDTQYGVTFVVLAPEHPLVATITTPEQKAAVEQYIQETNSKSEVERQANADKDKTGVFTGAYVINPANDEAVPVWIADYVLLGYGTGAVMGVPAHDDRDHVFAKKYGLEIRPVLKTDKDSDFHSEGVVINSDKYNGMRSEAMREQILKDFIEQGAAVERINYKIRDWLISRQRYWGAPIPIVWVEKALVQNNDSVLIKAALEQDQTKEQNGKTFLAVPLPEDQLPVILPEVESYKPDDSGRGPLARDEAWVHVRINAETGETKPFSDSAPATGVWVEGWRETDTMDGFACSSWYFLRFADPHNTRAPFARDKADFWLPVDTYIGGAEHAVMHLLYARFWTKVMYDGGLIDFNEPFLTLRNQGMILAPDGQKMSKSKNNTIEPSDLISQGYGADTVRIMELFIGPWNQSAAWSVESMGGCFRFLQRVWTLTQEYLDAQAPAEGEDKALLTATHKAIKKVGEDLHELGFNTAIAALMELTNELYKIKADKGFVAGKSWQFALRSLLQLLAPFAPHMTEELWHQLGNQGSIHISEWPQWDEQYLITANVTIVVQVNGKVRARLELPVDSTEATVTKAAQAEAKVKTYLDGKIIRKVIYVPNKLINVVAV